MENKICVYAICKNEEKHIDRWINSLKEADKIVVLDTGSTDNTISLLQKYAPLVEVHQQIIIPWRFDTARNESMKYIPSDTTICVISDCDQVFRPGWSAILKQHFSEGYEEVWGPIIDYDENNQEEKRFLSRNVHSYDPNWHWERPVHEGIEYHGNHTPLGIVDENFIIEHHPDRSKPRTQYLDILEREYKENSNDPYCAIYYGCELSFYQRDQEALSVFLKAVEECDFSMHQELGYQINLNIASYYYDFNQPEEGIKYALAARNYGIITRRLYIVSAKLYMQLGQYQQALQDLITAIEQVPYDNLSWTEDREWFTEEIDNLIAETRSHLNQVIIYGICKDEEVNIPQWYNGIKSADAIAIIDTGSTDNSITLLQSLNINVKSFHQDNFNFSVARNESLDYARTFQKDDNAIYICLDFDEFLEHYGIEKILINWDNNYNALTLNNTNVYNKVHSADPQWHWTRKIHEKLIGPEIKYKQTNITYIHNQDLNKKRDYYELLKQEKEEEKNNPQSLTLVYLAWEAGLHNDYENCAQYAKEALDILYNKKDDENYLNYEYIICCYIYIIQCNINREDCNNAINKIEEIIKNKLFPDFRRLRYILGEYYSSFNIEESKKQYQLGRNILTPIASWNDNIDLYKNKICIYAICKNEKQFVNQWLESMREADSIVVMDTGSTDGTYEYLIEKQQEYPQLIVAQQIITPWRFDVARNESMKYIPEDCNILFCTDLDETLSPGWADELRERWIEGKYERGLYLYTWSHLKDGSPGRIFLYDKIHSRNWEWRAPVHEYLFNVQAKTQDYNEMNTLNFSDTDIIHLNHYPDISKSRSSYLSLLELREQENPNDYYGLIYLAREYMFHGEYKKAIDKFNYIINNFKENIENLDYVSCFYFQGECYFDLKDYTNAINSLQHAIELEPTYRESYILLSQIYYTIQDYESAKSCILNGIQNSYRHYSWLEDDTSWTWQPWDLLCQICYYKGEKLASIGYAAKALSYEPTNQRLQDNLNICIELSEDKELL